MLSSIDALLQDNIEIRTIINNVIYLPVTFTSINWLLFAFSFTRKEAYLNLRNIIAFSLIPTITTILAMTNHRHFWMFGEAEIIEGVLTRDLHFWFWIHTMYSYSAIIAGSFLIIKSVFGKSRLYKNQGWIMIYGALIPFTANIAYLYFQPAISIDIKKTPDQDLGEITDFVKNYIKDYNEADHPAELNLEYEFAASLQDRINLLTNNGIVGLILVLIMLGLFLSTKLSHKEMSILCTLATLGTLIEIQK